jgi:hypothetical protein
LGLALIARIPKGAAVRLLLFFALGQAPTIETVRPLAVQPGQTTRLVFTDKNLANAASLWTSFPAEIQSVAADLAKGNRAVFDVTVPLDVPVQIGAVRLVSPKGLGPFQMLMVDDLPNLTEVSGNVSRERAQFVAGPIAVDGTGNGTQLDWFEFEAAKNETISFEVIANRLGSNFDPAAKLFDTAGRLLAAFGDSPGIAPDLQFRFQFEKTGRYFLRLRDMAYAGGRGSFFRLRVGDFPIVSGVYPQGNRRGELKPFYPIAEPSLPPVLATPVGSGFWLNFKSQNGVGSAYRRLATSAAVNVYETEPNDDRTKAAVFKMPAVLNGRFAQPDDRDWFAVTLAKGDRLKFTGATRTLCSPCDLMLRVTDDAGETLAESEITNTEDGEVSVEAKSDGIHFLEVRELADQFGKPLVYRVSAEKVRSGFSLTIAEHAFSAKAGQPVSIKVTAKRTKYEGVIQLQVTGGAADLKLEAATIGKGKNETTLKLTLPADAKPGMVLAFTVTGRGENGSEAVAHQTNESLLKQFRLMNQFPPELQTQLHAVAVE